MFCLFLLASGISRKMPKKKKKKRTNSHKRRKNPRKKNRFNTSFFKAVCGEPALGSGMGKQKGQLKQGIEYLIILMFYHLSSLA